MTIVMYGEDERINEFRERKKLQEKRTDPEYILMKEFYQRRDELAIAGKNSNEGTSKLIDEYSEKLGGISTEEFFHKFEIFLAAIDDDEVELRRKKYGPE